MTELPDRLAEALKDRYTIQRELGRGGMATVFLAEDLKHHRQVAIKVLRPELTAVIGGDRFTQEVMVTAKLQHPNILPLYDSGEAASSLYYVMPFVDGESLREKLDREGELSVDEVVGIASSVAAALDYAHVQGVVHRDIKPENILLQGGQAVVADFGVALALSAAGGTRLTETGFSLGTPLYMSPEQATADQALDGRTDVYSLACVVYEMVAGEPPFAASSAQAIIAKKLSETATHLGTFRETLPDHIDRAVAKGMSRHRADRFSTAGQLARALSDPSLTRDDDERTTVPAGAMLIDRRWAAALLVVAVAVGAAVSAWLGRGPPAHASMVQFRERPPQSQQVLGGEGLNPSISPDGSQFAYNGGAGGAEQLYVRRLGDLDARPIPGTDDATGSFFSPDGTWLGFVARGKLMKVALPGGSPLPIAEVQDVEGAEWGPGNFVVFSEGGRLMRVSAEGGIPELVASPDTSAGVIGLRWPHVLPGGREVLATAWYGSRDVARLAVVSIESGAVKPLALSGFRPQYSSGHMVFAQSDGQLVSVPFDLDKVEPVGEPTLLAARAATSQFELAEFALSESGTLVYSPALARSNDLVLVDRSGAATPLVNASGRGFQDPRFSPTGDRLAVDVYREGGVWLYDMDRRTLSPLAAGGGGGGYAAWLPDGRSLSFTAPERDGHQSLFKIAADGSGDRSLLYRGAHRVWESDWSPDGQWLAFRQGGVGELATLRDILVIRIDSAQSPPTPLAQTKFNESMLAISPDGRWLAYVSDQDGRREVYVRPFPRGAGLVQVSIDGGVEPSWSPGGRELFYRTPDAMAVATVEVAPTFRVIDRKILFPDPYLRRDNIANYDVDPRSGRLVMVRGNAAPGELVVILNWVEQLKAGGGK